MRGQLSIFAEGVSGRGSSAAGVDGSAKPKASGGDHESVGERQGRQPRPLTFLGEPWEMPTILVRARVVSDALYNTFPPGFGETP